MPLLDTELFEQFVELVEVGDEDVASLRTFVRTDYTGGFELVGEFAGTVIAYLERPLQT